MKLDLNQITVRTAVTEDASAITKWWNDGTVMAHAGFPNGLGESVESVEKQISYNNLKSQIGIIECDLNPVGELSYSIENHQAEIGIKICETIKQNQGMGRIVLSMLINYLFLDEELTGELSVERIVLDTNLNNTRAQHVYESLGFTKKGIRVDAWIDQLGEKQNAVDYEMTKESFLNGIRQIFLEEEKEKISKTILGDLPDWFGLEDSTKDYVDHSKKMPFWAYFSEGEATGFIALKETGKYTAEIYVMGVCKKSHRAGVGRKLYEAFFAYAKNHGYEYMQVKTVDEGRYEEYDRTRMFYESLGFRKLEVFPTLWDEWNPCLIMIQKVL